MKIESTSMSLQSSHQWLQREERHEQLQVWRSEPAASSQASISGDARSALAVEQGAQTTAAAIDAAFEAAANDPLIQFIKILLERLTGEEVDVYSPADHSARPSVGGAGDSAQVTPDPRPVSVAPRAGFGIELDTRQIYEEVEQTSVAARGTVRTADGVTLDFRLDIQMSRHFYEERTTTLRAGDVPRRDPLVLNFGGSSAQLGEARFAFDFFGRGRADQQMPTLAAGSGYLVFDRNGNGRVDSGRELFGPATNAGFSELATLDADGNGWLDENDAAFGQLAVWTPDASGNGELLSLRAAGIGALALAHIASPFVLRNGDGAVAGNVAASSVYLMENGGAGSVQEVDIAV